MMINVALPEPISVLPAVPAAVNVAMVLALVQIPMPLNIVIAAMKAPVQGTARVLTVGLIVRLQAVVAEMGRAKVRESLVTRPLAIIIAEQVIAVSIIPARVMSLVQIIVIWLSASQPAVVPLNPPLLLPPQCMDVPAPAASGTMLAGLLPRGLAAELVIHSLEALSVTQPLEPAAAAPIAIMAPTLILAAATGLGVLVQVETRLAGLFLAVAVISAVTALPNLVQVVLHPRVEAHPPLLLHVWGMGPGDAPQAAHVVPV